MKTTTTIKMLQINNTDLSMDVTPEKETEKAVYVELVNTRIHTFTKSWIPKSLITKTETGFSIPEWFLKKNFTQFYLGQNA